MPRRFSLQGRMKPKRWTVGSIAIRRWMWQVTQITLGVQSVRPSVTLGPTGPSMPGNRIRLRNLFFRVCSLFHRKVHNQIMTAMEWNKPIPQGMVAVHPICTPFLMHPPTPPADLLKIKHLRKCALKTKSLREGVERKTHLLPQKWSTLNRKFVLATRPLTTAY